MNFGLKPNQRDDQNKNIINIKTTCNIIKI